ncbi:MAG: Antidote-toxin recognition MazE, bacterial antitoxin [Verrucomicrobiota bacterium]
MIATVMREKRQVTLPQEVCDAAGLEPGDQVEWHVEEGTIHGRKLVPERVEELDTMDVDPKTLLPKVGKITSESITRAIRADRDRR